MPTAPDPTPPLALALHGGAGTLLRDADDHVREAPYRAALAAALDLGWSILERGGSALEAVEATAIYLEECPLFNAGKGAVYTSDGRHELDAAIMCGRTHQAGAVASVRTVRNPVALARRVLESRQFVFLAGAGAEAFADTTALERVEPEWFGTPRRLSQLKRAQERAEVVLDHDGTHPEKFGTIGVVALDRAGDLAAATSTGGLTNKRYGRVGDSPLIGAGTYADNPTCAISCTGYGEEFIRSVVAHDVSARMAYLGESLRAATDHVIMEKLATARGGGGMVAIDAQGAIATPFNTPGMYRAWRNNRGADGVGIFAEDPRP